MTKKQVQIYLPLSLIAWGVIFNIVPITFFDNPVLSPVAIFVAGNIAISLFFVDKMYSDKK